MQTILNPNKAINYYKIQWWNYKSLINQLPWLEDGLRDDTKKKKKRWIKRFDSVCILEHNQTG